MICPKCTHLRNSGNRFVWYSGRACDMKNPNCSTTEKGLRFELRLFTVSPKLEGFVEGFLQYFYPDPALRTTEKGGNIVSHGGQHSGKVQ